MVPNNHTTSSDSTEPVKSMTAGDLYEMKSIPDMPTDISCRDAALQYATAGIYVFPLTPIFYEEQAEEWQDKPAVKWRDASTTDAEQIKRWWPKGATHGIGIDCGKTNWLVIDIDDPVILLEHWKQLGKDLEDSPSPFQQSRANVTGDTGLSIAMRMRGHKIYTQPPGDSRLTNSRGAYEYHNDDDKKWGDVRGDGGYIRAFPSPHPKEGEYRWAETGVVPVLPVVLEQKLRMRTSGKKGDGSSAGSIVGTVGEGGRNNTLFNLGCSMRGKGFGDSAIREALRLENLERCTPPLSDGEVGATAESIVSRYAPGETINIPLAWLAAIGSPVPPDAAEDGDDDEDLAEHLKKVESFKETERAVRQGKRELDAEERAAIQSIDIISGDSILQMQDLRWLLTTEEGRGILATTGVFELTGQRQQFKTAIILDLLLSVVNKLDHWLTWPINSPACDELPHVVLAIGEGGAGIRRRIEAWLTAHPGASLDRFHLVPFNGFCLTSETDVTTIITTIKQSVGGAPVAVTVFDAFPDIFTGDENGSGDVGRAVTGMKRVARELGGGLCGVTQHTGHDPSRGRGSSRLPDAVDTVLHIEDRIIQATKVKEDDRDAVKPVAMVAVSVGNSFVVRRSEGTADAVQRNRMSPEAKARQTILKSLERHGEMHESAIKDRCGGSKASNKSRLDELVGEGLVDSRKEGRATFYEVKVTKSPA